MIILTWLVDVKLDKQPNFKSTILQTNIPIICLLIMHLTTD